MARAVLVDAETDQGRVRRVVSAHDVGTILNPLGHQGQIDGGVVMGVGSALLEGSDVQEGQVVAANLGDYKLASIGDIPALTTIATAATGQRATRQFGRGRLSQYVDYARECLGPYQP